MRMVRLAAMIAIIAAVILISSGTARAQCSWSGLGTGCSAPSAGAQYPYRYPGLGYPYRGGGAGGTRSGNYSNYGG